jgi:hypothetical protein
MKTSSQRAPPALGCAKDAGAAIKSKHGPIKLINSELADERIC